MIATHETGVVCKMISKINNAHKVKTVDNINPIEMLFIFSPVV